MILLGITGKNNSSQGKTSSAYKNNDTGQSALPPSQLSRQSNTATKLVAAAIATATGGNKGREEETINVTP